MAMSGPVGATMVELRVRVYKPGLWPCRYGQQELPEACRELPKKLRGLVDTTVWEKFVDNSKEALKSSNRVLMCTMYCRVALVVLCIVPGGTASVLLFTQKMHLPMEVLLILAAAVLLIIIMFGLLHFLKSFAFRRSASRMERVCREACEASPGMLFAVKKEYEADMEQTSGYPHLYLVVDLEPVYIEEDEDGDKRPPSEWKTRAQIRKSMSLLTEAPQEPFVPCTATAESVTTGSDLIMGEVLVDPVDHDQLGPKKQRKKRKDKARRTTKIAEIAPEVKKVEVKKVDTIEDLEVGLPEDADLTAVRLVEVSGLRRY